MISASDISIVLSGGISNTNPSQSLGGDASVFPVGNNVNNLFSDVTATQSSTGYVDYRCIYVVNNNAVDSCYNTNFSLANDVAGGSTVSFGVLARNDVQQLTINGSPSSGYIVLQYESALSPHIVWNPVPSSFALNIQNGLNSTTGLSQVVCAPGLSSSEFVITFTGDDGNRNQNLLVVATNAFSPVVPNPTITKLVNGGPKNDIAVNIGSPTVTPSGVVFTTNPIIINTIRPEEIVPLWFMRSTAAGVTALSDDGVALLINGTVLP